MGLIDDKNKGGPCQEQVKLGRLTYANVDDDVWYWAIVLDYVDCQSFDLILCGFHESALPSYRHVLAMMTGLIKDNPLLAAG